MIFINLEIEELDTNHSLLGLTTNPVASPFSPSSLSSRCRWYLSLGLINPFPKKRSWCPAFRSIRSHLHPGQWRSEELFLAAFWFHQCRSNIQFIFEPRLITFRISSFIQKIDALRWTPHMEECLQIVDERKECPNDEILVQQVRLQLLVEKMGQGTGRDGTMDSPAHTRGPPSLYSETLYSKLQDIKTHLLNQPQTDGKLLCTIFIRDFHSHYTRSASFTPLQRRTRDRTFTNVPPYQSTNIPTTEFSRSSPWIDKLLVWHLLYDNTSSLHWIPILHILAANPLLNHHLPAQNSRRSQLGQEWCSGYLRSISHSRPYY